MQQIRIDQLKRINEKADFLKSEKAIDDFAIELVKGVCDINIASSVPKEIRDENWGKIDIIEKVFDLQLQLLKKKLVGVNEEKVKIIKNILGESNSDNLMNMDTIGSA